MAESVEEIEASRGAPAGAVTSGIDAGFPADAAGHLSSAAEVSSWCRALAGSLAGIAAESDTGLVDRLRALEELKAAASAAQARVAAALDASVRAAHARAGLPVEKQGLGVGAQVALARRESPARGGRILGLAKALTQEMPCTLQALTEGRLSEWRATLLVRETACLSVQDRRLVDREIAGNPSVLEGLGDGRLIARVRKITCRIDQEALVRRAAKAEADRFVSCRPAPDTMTYLTGLLPVAQGVAVFAALSREADSLRARGDGRGRGQIMADTMVERITGQVRAEQVPVEVQLVMTDRTLLAGDQEPAYLAGYGVVPALWACDLVRKAAGSGPDGIARQNRSNGPTSTGRAPAGPAADGPAPTGPATDGPATDGPAPSGPAPFEPGTDWRDANGVPDGPDTNTADPAGLWLRRLYTAPSSGDLIAMESKARFVPASLARLITARDQICRTPWCSAPIRHRDHIRPHRSGGPTTASNIQGLCESCNHAKEAPGWSAEVIGEAGDVGPAVPRRRKSGPAAAPRPGPTRHTVEIITPTGHRYRSVAPPLPGAPPAEAVPR